MQLLVVSLVLTRLDFGNSALAGLSGSVLKRLQSAKNSAERVIFVVRKSEHITPLLRNSTGSSFRSRSTLSWVCSLFAVYTEWLHHTSPTSFTVWRT